jgi:hypothetical protein
MNIGDVRSIKHLLWTIFAPRGKRGALSNSFRRPASLVNRTLVLERRTGGRKSVQRYGRSDGVFGSTNRPCQAVFSTAGRTSFAGRITRRRTLPHFGGVFGVQATCSTVQIDKSGPAEVDRRRGHARG